MSDFLNEMVDRGLKTTIAVGSTVGCSVLPSEHFAHSLVAGKAPTGVLAHSVGSGVIATCGLGNRRLVGVTTRRDGGLPSS